MPSKLGWTLVFRKDAPKDAAKLWGCPIGFYHHRNTARRDRSDLYKVVRARLTWEGK